MVRGQIVLPKSVGYATGNIAEIVSDKEIRWVLKTLAHPPPPHADHSLRRLKSDFITLGKGGSSDVKATTKVMAELDNLKQSAGNDRDVGFEYKVLPYVEQHDMYGAVFQRLNEGDAIGIFPEGEWGQLQGGRRRC